MFLHTGDVSDEVTHYHVVLFDALVVRDDFYIANWAAETLAIECVVKLGWMVGWVVCDKIQISLIEPGVANMETIGYGEFQNSLTLCIAGTNAVPTVGITGHTDGSAEVTILVTNWEEYFIGWDTGNSVLQLVIWKFLVGLK